MCCPRVLTCDLWIIAIMSVCTAIIQDQNVTRNGLADGLWSGLLHHQFAYPAKFNRVSSKMTHRDILHIELLHHGEMLPILRASGAVQYVQVWERGTAGVRSRLDRVFWHDWRANAGNKSVSLTQCLSSSGIPLCPRQLPTNKDVWEENRSDHSSCQGEMHLVAVEICQKNPVCVLKCPLKKNYLSFFFSF